MVKIQRDGPGSTEIIIGGKKRGKEFPKYKMLNKTEPTRYFDVTRIEKIIFPLDQASALYAGDALSHTSPRRYP
jgi:hypothetical protein